MRRVAVDIVLVQAPAAGVELRLGETAGFDRPVAQGVLLIGPDQLAGRDEEKEHAVMTIEWLRRRDPVLDKHLRTYLFTAGSIIGIEHDAEAGAGPGAAASPSGSLGIGSLKGNA